MEQVKIRQFTSQVMNESLHTLAIRTLLIQVFLTPLLKDVVPVLLNPAHIIFMSL